MRNGSADKKLLFIDKIILNAKIIIIMISVQSNLWVDMVIGIK